MVSQSVVRNAVFLFVSIVKCVIEGFYGSKLMVSEPTPQILMGSLEPMERMLTEPLTYLIKRTRPCEKTDIQIIS